MREGAEWFRGTADAVHQNLNLIEDCIIMDYAVIRHGACLKRAIVDRYNTIEPGSKIGFDPEADRRNNFVTDSRITVVHKGPYNPDLARDH